MDVVDVSPPYDTSDVTASLANRVVLEMLSGIASRRKGSSNPRGRCGAVIGLDLHQGRPSSAR